MSTGAIPVVSINSPDTVWNLHGEKLKWQIAVVEDRNLSSTGVRIAVRLVLHCLRCPRWEITPEGLGLEIGVGRSTSYTAYGELVKHGYVKPPTDGYLEIIPLGCRQLSNQSDREQSRNPDSNSPGIRTAHKDNARAFNSRKEIQEKREAAAAVQPSDSVEQPIAEKNSPEGVREATADAEEVANSVEQPIAEKNPEDVNEGTANGNRIQLVPRVNNNEQTSLTSLNAEDLAELNAVNEIVQALTNVGVGKGTAEKLSKKHPPEIGKQRVATIDQIAREHAKLGTKPVGPGMYVKAFDDPDWLPIAPPSPQCAAKAQQLLTGPPCRICGRPTSPRDMLDDGSHFECVPGNLKGAGVSIPHGLHSGP